MISRVPTSIYIVSGDASANELISDLNSNGFECTVISYEESFGLEDHQPDLLLVDMDSLAPDANKYAFIRMLKSELELHVILLLSKDSLEDFDFTRGSDDFILKPCNVAELVIRIRQVLWRDGAIEGGNIIKHGDLVIDLNKYEVFVAGKLINLSFKEYELLKVLINNRDRVLTRDVLLDKVWGYDYFGGDRTVDVHIRRLRSKIEDAEHSFIDTVRNVGYKFKG